MASLAQLSLTPLWRRSGARAALAAVLLLFTAVTAGCTVQQGDPSAAYFPKERPVASGAPLLQPVADHFRAPLTTVVGSVSQPNSKLTPGVVGNTDATSVCAAAVPTPTVSLVEQTAVFQAYGLAFNAYQSQYSLDYLVPLGLGGAAVQANLWPMALKGVGFYQKEQLNARLRILVCQGTLNLTQVQQQLQSNWYSLWLHYGS